jgi:hypothetical protein
VTGDELVVEIDADPVRPGFDRQSVRGRECIDWISLPGHRASIRPAPAGALLWRRRAAPQIVALSAAACGSSTNTYSTAANPRPKPNLGSGDTCLTLSSPRPMQRDNGHENDAASDWHSGRALGSENSDSTGRHKSSTSVDTAACETARTSRRSPPPARHANQRVPPLADPMTGPIYRSASAATAACAAGSASAVSSRGP